MGIRRHLNSNTEQCIGLQYIRIGIGYPRQVIRSDLWLFDQTISCHAIRILVRWSCQMSQDRSAVAHVEDGHPCWCTT